MNVRYGIDQFLAGGKFATSTRFALVTNNSACTACYEPSRLALLQRGWRIMKLFSPEHGLQAAGPDGRPMAGGTDRMTRLPVVSLYGEQLEPGADSLADVDAVLFDLPDVGSRCYTYLWTLSHVMEACNHLSKPLIILDRPNPISGVLDLAEGPILDEKTCSSFIGRWDIPLRHSCTFGELAFLWKRERLQNLNLQVIKAEGWSRSMFYHDGLSSFVPTSPAIASAETCLLYSGLCLLEATNLSEGRGTTTPFRVAGAPWLDAIGIVEQFNRTGYPGAVSRAVTFVPESGKYRGENCNGIMIHVTEVSSVRPVWLAACLIKTIVDAHPQSFVWSTYPTLVNPTGERHLDKLLGVHNAENLFTLGREQFIPALQQRLGCADWKSRIRPHLLYA